MTLEDLLGRLQGVQRRGTEHMAKCPAHDDRRQSLSVTTGRDDRLLLKCHAGCRNQTILDTLGLQMSDLFAMPRSHRNGQGLAARIVSTYDYRDETGTVLFQTVRLEPKDFRQRRPNRAGGWIWNLHGVRLVLYRLDLLRASRSRVVYVVEGEKDADALHALGLAATTSPMGAGKWRPEYAEQLQACGPETIILVPDADPPGIAHMTTVGHSVRAVGLACRWLELPDLPQHGDLSDWLAAGGTLAELQTRTDAASAWPARATLAAVHTTFRKWLGPEYDLDVLDIVLAVAAAERLTGDPPWLLVVSAPGNAKTETVQPLEGAGAVIISTIASEGALLSASSGQNRAKDATGGLLRQLGARGILAIKDVTSLLSADRNVRSQVLAALREIHDGRWVRNVGVDGGRSLSWAGRIVVIGAVTTAWDAAHAVIAACGDRFLLVRANARTQRHAKSQRARQNTGKEVTMRAELATVVGQLLDGIPSDHPFDLDNARWAELVRVADVVAFLRTGVDTDYRGDVLMAHDPEVPTRLVKQLGQLMRGATAIGLSLEAAFRLALRVCRDCVPPTRLRVIRDVADHPNTTPLSCGRRLGLPRTTVGRVLDSLRALDLLDADEIETVPGKPWLNTLHYTVAPTVDRVGLARLTAEHCLVLTLSGFVSERGVGEQEVVREKGCSDDDDTRTSPATHFPGQGYPPDWDTV